MRLRLKIVTTSAAVALLASAGLAGCTATPAPTETVAGTPASTPTPAPSSTPSPTPTMTPSGTPAPEPTAAASYDLEAAYDVCVGLSEETVASPGTYTPFDSADTNPIAEEKITTPVSDDPDALMMHVHWTADSGDWTSASFCSISGPFDDPIITLERASTSN